MLTNLKSGLVHADLSSKFGKCHQGGCAINSGLNPYQVEYSLKSVSLDGCAMSYSPSSSVSFLHMDTLQIGG